MAEHYQINIQFPEAQREALNAAAADASVKVSTFIRILVLQALRGGTLAEQLEHAKTKARELATGADGDAT